MPGKLVSNRDLEKLVETNTSSTIPRASRSGAVSFIRSQASACRAASFQRMEAKPSGERMA